MSPRNLLRLLAERRRVRHQDPWAPAEMTVFRRKVWRLVRARS